MDCSVSTLLLKNCISQSTDCKSNKSIRRFCRLWPNLLSLLLYVLEERALGQHRKANDNYYQINAVQRRMNCQVLHAAQPQETVNQNHFPEFPEYPIKEKKKPKTSSFNRLTCFLQHPLFNEDSTVLVNPGQQIPGMTTLKSSCLDFCFIPASLHLS